MPHYLDPIIHPRTMAIIGASKDPAKRGYRAIKSLITDNYQGQIIPINPKETEILGFKCYPSLDAVPQDIDLALVCTAAITTPGVIESCGKKGVKGAVLLAGGFSEASEKGRILEEETVSIARKYKVRLIGPNTNGMFSARLGCNALGTLDIPRGPLAILSNSANVMSSVLNESMFHGYAGISTMLSVGNQSDILFHEYLECFGSDPDTQAIIMYIEGFKDGKAFTAAARNVAPVKPIVMYLAGRNAEGKGAAKSHSGSLAGDYAVGKGVLQQSGVLVVSQSDRLYPVTEALTLLPPMQGRRVAILSEGGGPITVAAEACAERGLVLAQLSPATQAKIHEIVPNATAISNPVDAGGGTDPRVEYYRSISEAILEDPNIDALLFVGLFGGYAMRWGESVAETEYAVCEELGEMMRKYGKPIMVQSHFAHLKTRSLDVLRKAGVPFQRHIEVAVDCLRAAADYQAAKTRLSAAAPTAGQVAPAAAKIVQMATRAGRNLLEPEAKDLLRAYDIAVPPQALMRSADNADAVVEALGSVPLAMKVVSKDILHKSEAGGVKLNLAGPRELASAFDEIRRSALAYRPGADIEGMLVTPMARRGTEVIIGVTRDPQYGPVIMFGLGGVFVEVIRDVVFRALPLTPADAQEMVAELRYKAMLDGARGAEPVDKAALTDLLLRVSALATLHPEIAEIDLNPVIAHADGYAIVDARMILADSN
jgi:acyl-CoA synthetase (NDP forming)